MVVLVGRGRRRCRRRDGLGARRDDSPVGRMRRDGPSVRRAPRRAFILARARPRERDDEGCRPL